MSQLFKHENCRGCESLGSYESELVCTNLVNWHSMVPENPPCYSVADRSARNLAAMEMRSLIRAVDGTAA